MGSAPHPPNPSTHVIPLRPIPIAIAFGCVGTALALAFPINMDAGYMLRTAEQMLEGRQLYHDIIMSHPPLTFWFAEAIVAASRAAGITPMHGIQAATALLGAISMTVCARLGRERMLPAFAFAYFVLPGYRFPQEEVWLMALIVPYVLSFDPDARLSRRMAVLTGIMAGLGFAIKPYFLLAYAALEIYRRDPLRPQNVAVMATGAAYGLSMLALTPYFFPFALWAHRVYGPFLQRSVLQIALSWRALVVLEAAILCILHLRRRGPDRLAMALLLSALAFLVCVFWQGKGFDYHYYPALAFAVLIVGHLAARRPLALTSVCVIGTVSGALLTVAHWRTPTTNGFYLADTVPIVRRYGGPIAVVGVQMRPVWPLANYAGVEVASRFPSLWTLPYVATRGTPAEQAELRVEVVEDFRVGRPRVVFVQHGGFLDFFLADPAFRALWGRYRHLTTVGPYGVFVSQGVR